MNRMFAKVMKRYEGAVQRRLNLSSLPPFTLSWKDTSESETSTSEDEEETDARTKQ